MKIAFLGNHVPTFSTESHVALSLESLGHEVVRFQEGEVRAVEVARLVAQSGADLFIWTATYGLSVTGGTREERAQMLEDLRAAGTPSLGFHLDRWWGLDRQDQIPVEPFFRVDLLATADGGHEREFVEAGINHVWSPPAVYHGEVGLGRKRKSLQAAVCFVGSWKSYGHKEWEPHRLAMLDAVRQVANLRCWPADGRRAVRGALLNDIYASTAVVVGDSCLVPSPDGSPASFYHSDRIPETLGRGGFLIHPWVKGIDEHYKDGEHLRLYELGNHAELQGLVQHYVAHPDEARSIAEAGCAHVREHHTYRHRLERLLEMVP